MPLTQHHIADLGTHAILAWSSVCTVCACLAVKSVFEGR